jgi:beta-glucosidase
MHSNHPHFTAPSSEIEKRINGLLSNLTLEEKLDLLGGEHDRTKSNERAGIPMLKLADGPTGVHWWCKSSTAYPGTVALAASWDLELSRRMGTAIGRDSRARGVHILLAPGVNIYRSPLCGRNFEYLGEDPFLASRMVVPYVQGCQDQGVAVTVKHYAANFQEYDRYNVSSDVDERTLREVYLPAFRAAVEEGGAGCVMTSYNLLNGVHCSEHPWLIQKVLKGEWGFDGVVMSDWGSVHSAELAALAGLDLEMGSAKWMNRDNLLASVQAGIVPEAVIDDKILRLLRLAACFGWLDHPQKDESIPQEDESSAQAALDIIRHGAVLLKNENEFLPIRADKVRRLAVIGSTADPAVMSGGGSAYTHPWRTASILEGIRSEAGEMEIVYAKGVDAWAEEAAFSKSDYTTPEDQPGLKVEYFANRNCSGESASVGVVERPIGKWNGQPIPEVPDRDNFSIRWTGTLRVPAAGRYRFLMRANGGTGGFWLEGRKVLPLSPGGSAKTHFAELDLKAGQEYPLQLEYRQEGGWNEFYFGWEDLAEVDKSIAAAAEVAASVDAVIFCGGHTAKTEFEGADRNFEMPPDLERLLLAVAKANPKMAVVLTGGGHIDMRAWVESVPALLHAFYLGQEGGRAVAEILFGKVNPSGKLPFTAERNPEDRSSFGCYHDTDGDRRVMLKDGIFGGYRHFDKTGLTPLFSFGFGLSYTQFAYSNLRVSTGKVSARCALKVTFDLTNTGMVAGAEIAQLYVADSESSFPRPPKELKGFAKTHLAPGETKSVVICLCIDAFQFFDFTRREWVAEPGTFELLIGASASDIRLKLRVILRDDEQIEIVPPVGLG